MFESVILWLFLVMTQPIALQCGCGVLVKTLWGLEEIEMFWLIL